MVCATDEPAGVWLSTCCTVDRALLIWSLTVGVTWLTWLCSWLISVVAAPADLRSSSWPSSATLPLASTDFEVLTPVSAFAARSPTWRLTSGSAAIGGRAEAGGDWPRLAARALRRRSPAGSAFTSEPLATEDTAVDDVGAPVPRVLWVAL